jgi:sec-independent protein translocase protein TatA
MRALEPWHILILVVVIAILFGSKKLPDAARGLGRSMRIFKSEVDEMKKEGKTPSAASSDTVKGETVKPKQPGPDVNGDGTWSPTATSGEPQTHNQPPL